MKQPIWLKIWYFLDTHRDRKYNFIDVIRGMKISSNSLYSGVEFLIRMNLIEVRKDSRNNEITLLETTQLEKKLLRDILKTYEDM